MNSGERTSHIAAANIEAKIAEFLASARNNYSINSNPGENIGKYRKY